MAVHDFTIYLNREPNDDELDLLFDAGFADSTPELGGNEPPLIHVHREAPTLQDALVSAILGAEQAGFRVTSVANEDIVSLRTIANRLGKTSEYVRLLANGQRGPGGFPVAMSGDGWSLYSWTEVAKWARDNLGTNTPEDDRVRILALTNHYLRARAIARETDKNLIKTLVAA